jgi:4-amino-4-deoxy-L-arabinose transferase-like glycosyltransferase
VRPALAVRPLVAVVAAKAALNLAFSGRYGWQRDELYYYVAGKHLQAGYVDYPPVTALLSAAARSVFGGSLVGFRLFAILAGTGTIVVAALVARELGGNGRAQTIAAALVAFSPILIATNGLFQPVSFDQLATMVVLWLAVRVLTEPGPGPGSVKNWVALGVAAGVGLETKYTLAVVLVALIACVLVWRRDLLRGRGFCLALAIAAALVLPNLVWQARHDWISVRFFVNPPGSATDESRPEFVVNLLLLSGLVTVPVWLAGIRRLVRDRALRPLGWAIVVVLAAYFVLGGKSYYALPVLLFALAVGAQSLAEWASARGLRVFFAGYALFLLLLLPIGLPVLPQKTAIDLGLMDARSDYADELGWPELTRTVERHARGADVVIVANYGEAGALDLYGHRLPPVASGHVTFRYWRPDVDGRNALLVGFRPGEIACSDYRVVARIAMPVDNEERDAPVARCTLDRSLAELWPQIVALYD